MMRRIFLYYAHIAHYTESGGAKAQADATGGKAMNFSAIALLLAEFIAACSLIVLPFSLVWAGLIFIGSI